MRVSQARHAFAETIGCCAVARSRAVALTLVTPASSVKWVATMPDRLESYLATWPPGCRDDSAMRLTVSDAFATEYRKRPSVWRKCAESQTKQGVRGPCCKVRLQTGSILVRRLKYSYQSHGTCDLESDQLPCWSELSEASGQLL